MSAKGCAIAVVILARALAVWASEQPAKPVAITNCAPTFVISEPGSYRVTRNLTAASGRDCIDISASNVVLDLGGFTLSGSGRGGVGVNVVSTEKPVSDVEVRNGALSGFPIGVDVSPAIHVRVLYLRISGSTPGYGLVTGIDARTVDTVVR